MKANEKADRKSKPLPSGSAYLVVLGVISVLLIIVVTFFKANTSRRYLTRFTSNEKKAEALAEASIDLALRYIKDHMNDKEDGNIYPYFRYPTEILNGNFGEAGGKNSPLNLEPYNNNPLPSFDFTTPALVPIANMLSELGGKDYVKLDLKCEVVAAEAFTSKKSDYAVTGITIKPRPTNGETAAFLDDFDQQPTSAGTTDSLIGSMGVKVNLPNFQARDEEEIDIPLINGKATLIKDNDYTVTAKIDIDLIPEIVVPVDINQLMKTFIDIGSEPFFSLAAIRRVMMPQTSDADLQAIEWKASKFKERINANYDRIPTIIKGMADKTAFRPSKLPKVVEKGGILRFTADVEYMPQGKGGPVIKRMLKADREFKVSDIQPPAPEYSLFIANSNLLFEQDTDKYTGEGMHIGQKIDLVGGIATFCVHNLPSGEYKSCTGFNGTPGPDDDMCQVPGQIRINANEKMGVNTFLGTVDEPTLTEFNALAMDKFATPKPKFNLYPTFQWKSRVTNPDRAHEIDFPVLRNTDFYSPPLVRIGLVSLLSVLNLCDALAAPTLLFGHGHFEYPLGLRVEAPLESRYANLLIVVKPEASILPPGDVTEVKIYYRNLNADFGLQGKPGFSNVTDWSPDKWECMPPNLYSLLQYAKKATHFYENEGAFWNDRMIPKADEGRKAPDGSFDCSGVTYIKGDLTISSPLQVSGKGIVVVRDNINISANIERLPGAVFSLIARRGAILVNAPCNKIDAACYSNYSLQNSTGNTLVIDGNLVTNEFTRDTVESVEVFYNSAACRITPLSVQRDIGKYDPERYIVSLGKRWARFEYAKQH